MRSGHMLFARWSSCLLLAAAGLKAANIASAAPKQPHVSARGRIGQTVMFTATEWPAWRGPRLDGKAADERVPTTWSETENIRWKIAVPGRGHSSPVVCRGRIVLTTADEDAKRILMLAYDPVTGREMWQTELYQGELMHRHTKNSHASATPACDGQRLFVSFIARDALHVAAVGLDGKIAWSKSVAAFVSQHGYGASPVLYKHLVIVASDNSGPGHLIALDRRSGEITWQTRRGDHASYSTPIIGQWAGKPQVLLSGCDIVAGYDPEKGSELWRVKGPTEVTACTMAFGSDLAFASGGFPGKGLLAIRPNGKGDVTATHIAWQVKTGVTYVPSPLYDNGVLYMINDQGVAQAFNAKTGKVLWKHRLGGNFTASPILVGENIFIANEEGSTFVFAAGSKFHLIAENKLDEGQYATPAVADGTLYLRTAQHLYAIGPRQ